MWVYVKEIQKEKEKEKALHSHWPSLLDSGSTWCWRTHAGPAAATAEGDARLDLRLCGRRFSKSAQDAGCCCSARPGRHVVVPASLSHQAPGGSAALVEREECQAPEDSAASSRDWPLSTRLRKTALPKIQDRFPLGLSSLPGADHLTDQPKPAALRQRGMVVVLTESQVAMKGV